mgnify:FL=1
MKKNRKVKYIALNDYNRNNILNFAFKIVGMFLGIVSVRLNLKYLGNSLYGMWVTISAIISWMSSADLGIGNGLRNELAQAFGKGDTDRQGKLVACGLTELSKVSCFVFLFFLIISQLMIKGKIIDEQLRIPLYITTIFLCINLVLGISQAIAYGCQKSWLVTLTISMISLLNIINVSILLFTGIPQSLIVFSISNGMATVLPNIFLFIILKRKNMFCYRKCKKEYDVIKKSIINIGLQFFCLQLCAVILYSTDNVIINYLINSEMVTKYSVITSVYDMGSSLFAILLIPFWSAVTFHVAKNEFKWVENTLYKLLIIWGFYLLGVILVSIMFNRVVQLWLGDNAYFYETSLIITFAIYCGVTCFSSIFVNMLNGLGKIKLQLWLAIIESLINIPLSVILAQKYELGILGVKLATLFCALINAIVLPIQAVVIIKKKRMNGEVDENSSCS